MTRAETSGSLPAGDVRSGNGHADSADALRVATELSRLLRRASLLLDPRAAALRGEEWLAFLDARLPAGNTTFLADGKALVDAPFRRPGDAGMAVDVAALIALTRRWLVHALREAPVHA